MTTDSDLREAICEVGRRMYDKDLVSATDGNISVRLEGDRYLCTPSGVSKGFMKPGDMIVSDGKGNKISGDGKVTSEFFTHMAAYEERPDVHAVVHAHPPKAVGFTLAGVSMADWILPEVAFVLGGIPTAQYATPASKEGAVVIRELIRECDALLLDRHGAVTVGADMMDAYFKMEKIEHAAESILTAHLLGTVRHLDEDELKRLTARREAFGVKNRIYGQ